MRDALRGLDERCAGLMQNENVCAEDVEIRYFADICYVGQSHYLEIPLTLDGDVGGKLYDGFREAHNRIFGHAAKAPAQIVNLRAIHRSGGDRVIEAASIVKRDATAQKATRDIIVQGHEGRLKAAVYDREMIAPGTMIEGPAILEQSDTTTVVPPGWSINVLDGGNILMKFEEGDAK